MEKQEEKIMWTENQEQLREKNLPGVGIKESGCYECKIERAELFISSQNKAEALILTLKSIADEKTARIPIFYKNKKGEEQLFNTKHLNQLIYLLKIKFENLKTETDEEDKEIFPMLQNRKIGVFLSFLGMNEVVNTSTGEINYFNEYQLRGFYNTKTGKTTQEIIDKVENAETFEIWKKNFINENKIREKRELENGTNIINSHIKNEAENQDEEDFPF